MRKRTSIFALLGLGVALLTVWGASAFVVDAAYSDTANAETRFEQAERLLFYKIEPGQTVSLLIPPDAESIRVFSHLVLPKGADAAVERRYLYGLNLKLWDPEGVQHFDRELYTRTRQSKADRTDQGWGKRSVFLSDESAEVTDGRDFLIRLPPNLRARATSPALLLVGHSGTEGTLLVRVSARFAKVAGIVALQNRSAVDRAIERVERATFIPWAKLPTQTQAALSAETWQRLGARGELGQDYWVEAVYRTDFRLSADELMEDSDSRLAGRTAVPFNVQGPASIGVRLWREQPGADSRVLLRQRAIDGTEKTSEVELKQAEVSLETLEVGPGLHTIEVHNDGADELRYALHGSSRALLGSAEDAPDEVVTLQPDRRDGDAFLVGDGNQHVELEVPQSGSGAPLLRVDARAVAFGSDTLQPTKLTLRMLGGDNSLVGEATLDLPADAAAFEGLTVADHGSLNVEGRVSSGVVGRIFIPEGAKKLSVTADRRAAVQLSAWLPSPVAVKHAPPFVDDALGRTRWRAAPLQTRSWYPLRPSNFDLLWQSGARGQLWSYVRLEPIGPSEAQFAGQMMTVKPVGRPATLELLEGVADATDSKSQLWTRLSSGDVAKLQFPAKTRYRPELRVFADAKALGRPVEVVVDGRVIYRKPLRATRSRILLPPIRAGEHDVQVRGADLTALVNRAASEDAALKSRTAFALTDRGLRVRVHKPSQDAVTLNVLVYSREAEPIAGRALKVLLDNGNPKRRSGILVTRVSIAERQVALEKSERPAAYELGQTLSNWYGRTFAVTLGEDLPAGTHWVDVVPATRGGTTALWARFFVHGHPPQSNEPRQWTRPGWELEGAL